MLEMDRKYITQILIKTFGGDMPLFLFCFSVFFVHDTEMNYVIIKWTMWAGEWRVWKLEWACRMYVVGCFGF
jgi:hypothetical protein